MKDSEKRYEINEFVLYLFPILKIHRKKCLARYRTAAPPLLHFLSDLVSLTERRLKRNIP